MTSEVEQDIGCDLEVRYDVLLPTPIGAIGLRAAYGDALGEVSILGRNVAPFPESSKNGTLSSARAWFHAYFNNPKILKRRTLHPARPDLTEFQLDVLYNVANLIPFGECMTYGELAKHLGTSARAVGMACRSNPLPILIPCHRVVAKDGLGGYLGNSEDGQFFKSWLLEHEAEWALRL